MSNSTTTPISITTTSPPISTTTTSPPTSTTTTSPPTSTTTKPQNLVTTTPTLSQAQSNMISASNNISQSVFNKFNIIFLIWFLAIYLIIYFILGIFYNSDSGTSKKLIASRIFDFLVLLFFLITIVFNFLSLSDSDKQTVVTNNTTNLMNYINTLSTLLYIILFFVLFYAIIYLTGIPMTMTEKPMTISLIEGFAWILFALCLIANFCKYVLGVSIADLVNQWIQQAWNQMPNDLSGNKAKDLSGNKAKDLSGNKAKDLSGNVATAAVVDISNDEVFNISNNIYTYDDAKSVCQIYGARLATYDDIEKSYNDGGEWCNYGWSEDQMIYFPTQKTTWDKLQKDPKTKNNCGRPGINGGYIDNPYVTFGVNCYGKKPKPTADELKRMSNPNSNISPKTPEDILLEKKMEYWKNHAADLLNINSFNQKKWSEY
jgi:hypothetical protein